MFAPVAKDKREEVLKDWKSFKKKTQKFLQGHIEKFPFNEMEDELLEEACMPSASKKLIEIKGKDRALYKKLVRQLAFLSKAFYEVRNFGKKNKLSYGEIDCNDQVSMNQVLSLITNQQICRPIYIDQHVSLLLTGTDFVLDTYDGKICLLQEHVLRRYNEEKPGTGRSTYFYQYDNKYYIIDNALKEKESNNLEARTNSDLSLVPGFHLATEKQYSVFPYDDLASLLVSMAINYERSQKSNLAQKIYENLIMKIAPDYYNAIYNNALIYRDQGQINVAEELLLKSLKINPFYSHTYADLASCFKKSNDLKRAKETYVECLQLDPFNSLAHNNLGVILGQESQMDLAEQHYRKAIQYDPKNSDAYNNLGHLLTNKNGSFYNEAQQMLDSSLDLRPGHLLAHNNSIKLAKLQYEKKDSWLNFDRVLMRMSAKTDIFTEDASCCLELADFIFQNAQTFINKSLAKKYYKIAIVYYETAIDRDQDLAEPYFKLGWIYQYSDGLKDLHLARSCYEKSIALNSRMDGAHNNLALIYEDMGDLENAMRHLQVAIQQVPGDSKKKNNLERVQQKIKQRK